MERSGGAEQRPWWTPDSGDERAERQIPDRKPAQKSSRTEETVQREPDREEKRSGPDRADQDKPLLQYEPNSDQPPDGGPERLRLERHREELATTLAKLPPELRYRFEAAISQDGGDWSFERGQFLYMYVVRTETLQTEAGAITIRERLTLRRDRPLKVLTARQRRQLAESLADPEPSDDESPQEPVRQTSDTDRIEVTAGDGGVMLFEVPATVDSPRSEPSTLSRFKRVRADLTSPTEAGMETSSPIEELSGTSTKHHDTSSPELTEPAEIPPAEPEQASDRAFPRLTVEELEMLITTAYRGEAETLTEDSASSNDENLARNETSTPAVPTAEFTGPDAAEPSPGTPVDRPVPHEEIEPASEAATEPPTSGVAVPASEAEQPTNGEGFDRLMMEVVTALDETTPLPRIAGGSPELDRLKQPSRPRHPRPEEPPDRRDQPPRQPASITESVIRPSRVGEGRLIEWERRHRNPEDPPDRELRRKARKLARLLARRYGLRLTPEMEVKLMEAILRPRIVNGHEVYGLGLNREHVLDIIRTLWLYYPAAAPRIKPDVY